MPEPIFDAPIPGSSLTAEIGSRAWKNPPQYDTVEEVLDFYIERMSSDEFSDKLIHALDLGVSVTQIANLMQIHGVMEGQHTLDVSMLILPVLMEFIRLIADTRGIEYNMGVDEHDPERADDALVVGAVRKLKEATKFDGAPIVEGMEDLEEEEVIEEEVIVAPEEEMATGLMSRGA
jgi:hypothetical protein